MDKVKAYLYSDVVSSNSDIAMKLFEKSFFGEKVGEKIIYSFYETLYLIEEGKLELFDLKNKNISFERAFEKFQVKDKNIGINYLVFKDLRNKGYIVKSALKFGCDFRIYEKGSKLKESHSNWLCITSTEKEKIKWVDFVAKNRIAHSTNKKLLIALLDEEGDITYFEVCWLKP